MNIVQFRFWDALLINAVSGVGRHKKKGAMNKCAFDEQETYCVVRILLFLVIDHSLSFVKTAGMKKFHVKETRSALIT